MAEERVIKIYSEFGTEFVPATATDGSVGIDVRAPHDILLPRGFKTVVDSGLVIDVSDYLDEGETIFCMAVPRSSAGSKKDIFFLNTVGIIDPDYSGYDPETGEIDSVSFHIGRRAGLFETFYHTEAQFEPGLSNYMVRSLARELVQDILTDNPELLIYEDYDSHTGEALVTLVKRNPPNSRIPTKDDIIYREGERFAQLIFFPYIPASVQEIAKEELRDNTRGGFGSTGLS